MLKQILSISALAIAITANAADSAPHTFRTLKCSGSVADVKHGNVEVAVTGVLTDLATDVLDENGKPMWQDFTSTLDVSLNGQKISYFATGNSEDPVDNRDSDPGSSSGWGGMQLFGNPADHLNFAVLKSAMNQIEKDSKFYTFGIAQAKDPNLNDAEPIYQGHLTCTP